MTLTEVAAAAGVSESYLSNVENGKKTASPQWIGTVMSVIAERLGSAA